MQNPKTRDWVGHIPHPTSSARMLPGFMGVVKWRAVSWGGCHDSALHETPRVSRLGYADGVVWWVLGTVSQRITDDGNG